MNQWHGTICALHMLLTPHHHRHNRHYVQHIAAITQHYLIRREAVDVDDTLLVLLQRVTKSVGLSDMELQREGEGSYRVLQQHDTTIITAQNVT